MPYLFICRIAQYDYLKIVRMFYKFPIKSNYALGLKK